MKKLFAILLTIAILLCIISTANATTINESVMLPFTGGSGSTLFVVGGGAIAVIAGAILVARKKSDNNEEE